MKKLAVPIFVTLAAIGFVVAIWLVFLYAPLEVSKDENRGSSLFFNQKIFYFHVNQAFMLFIAVGVAGVCSAVYLAKRKPGWDDVAFAAVEVAVAFGLAVLVTGSIWAKAAWDVWWNWEPRLTMSLLLWLVLVGYVIVRRFAGPTGDRIAAGMALFGMVGVPFIYTMVGKDSHPKSGADGVVMTLGTGEKIAFWVSFVAFTCWFLALVIARVQSTRAERQVRELRERALDLGVLS